MSATLSYVHGASDRHAAYPAIDPVTPQDYLATAYRALGVDPETTAFSAPIPATGSLAGDLAAARTRRGAKPSRRTRKVYRLTPAGEGRLQQLLLDDTAGSGDDERVFAMKLAFCGHLDPAARVELLERRRAALADRLSRAQRLGTGRGDRYARSLFEHRTQATQRDLEWVEALIEAETDPNSHIEGATAS